MRRRDFLSLSTAMAGSSLFSFRPSYGAEIARAAGYTFVQNAWRSSATALTPDNDTDLPENLLEAVLSGDAPVTPEAAIRFVAGYGKGPELVELSDKSVRRIAQAVGAAVQSLFDKETTALAQGIDNTAQLVFSAPNTYHAQIPGLIQSNDELLSHAMTEDKRRSVLFGETFHVLALNQAYSLAS